MKLWKKVAALALIAGLCCTVAACDDGKNSTAGPGQSSSAGVISVPLPTEEELAAFEYEMTDTTCTITGLKDKMLMSVTIPNGVTTIGRGAFRNCDVLMYVTIPDSVTDIDGYAFSGCRSLTSVTIPESVTYIGVGAFVGCTSLQYNLFANANYLGNASNPYLWLIEAKSTDINNCVIYEGCKGVASGAFYGCTSLRNVTIPDSVTDIWYEAFEGCKSLTKVNYTGTIDQWVQIEFDDQPLKDAHNLYINDVLVTEANITTASKINAHAFKNCDSLTSITIPDGVTSIGENAFSGCESLTKVNYTGTIDQWVQIDFDCRVNYVTTSNPLAYAHNLYINDVLVTEANITTASEINSGAFFGCDSLTSVTIGDSVTSIGDCAFKGCTSLTSVTIPDGVKEIGYWAFRDCTSLTSITIPDSVTSIGIFAFYGCTSLTTVYYNGTESEWNSISIGNWNVALTSATRYYYSESAPTTEGNFWHYVDDVPTVW